MTGSPLPHHPLAELFPMMPEQEIREMADDICTFGQRVPIVLLDGQVLDGRNRQAACIFAEIEPEFTDYDGDDPLNFVLSHNLHRRHLTDSQRAMVAAKIVDWETGMNQHLGGAHMPAHKAAERLSISERAVKAARRIHEHGTAELIQSIRDGRLSVRSGEALSHLEDQAQRDALRLEEKQIIARAKEIRTGRQKLRHTVRLGHMEIVTERGQATSPRKLDRTYPVYYADPPWRFGVRSEETGREKSAENHYPTMTTDEICALLAGLVGEPATPGVLFLWATNPMLLDALRVMHACGFTYVHHWIWDKEVAGTGYWGRDRHELLLIGRRGDVAAPLPGTQPETVYREKKGRHSAKPDYFAEVIERLFPGVGRLELFARQARPGWDAWGFEAPAESMISPPEGEMAGRPEGGAVPSTGPTVSEAELAEFKALGAVDGGVEISGAIVADLIERGKIWPGKQLSLTIGGAERLAELQALVDAARTEGDGVRVLKPTDAGGTAPPSVLPDISPSGGEIGRPKRRGQKSTEPSERTPA